MLPYVKDGFWAMSHSKTFECFFLKVDRTSVDDDERPDQPVSISVPEMTERVHCFNCEDLSNH